MNKEDVFYTKTMAKVYADQGKLEKAVEIYQYLLEKEPGRQDLIDAISEIDKKRLEKDPERLGDLLSIWLDLLLRHSRLQQLKKLKTSFKRLVP
ncbi:MAG: hypothetical protein H8D96_09500 [Desulfobacterales bacterium]|uniref:Tetratricopeptide repeat protein n=1 Tax=Candidatus Desulfatibia vada TaxID=2841696 RepID=A0A8J6NY63_9BACT|nr:hypothetical protein [Candidatus Desulfatibia vada]MBL6971389.1 hypothetical protein [Desulfobacterales bacterium]